jgi:hypothetical protein
VAAAPVTSENFGEQLLALAGALIGTLEVPGAGDNPVILAWGREIGRRVPRLKSYCANYQHDETAWCGYFEGYLFVLLGLMPPYDPGDDLHSFMWAQSWKDLPGQRLDKRAMRRGCVVVFPRHVSTFDHYDADGNAVCLGGNQGDSVKFSSYDVSSIEEAIWPDVDKIRLPGELAPIGVTVPVGAAASRINTNIMATIFRDDSVAYPDVAPGWNDRAGFSLPAWVTAPRPWVKATCRRTGRSSVGPIIDQGPWNRTEKARGLPGDPYWLTGSRPQAESGTDMTGRRTNRAGIDATPASAREMGLNGLEPVDWEFVNPDGSPIQVPPAGGSTMTDTTVQPPPAGGATQQQPGQFDVQRLLQEIVGANQVAIGALTRVNQVLGRFTGAGSTTTLPASTLPTPEPAVPSTTNTARATDFRTFLASVFAGGVGLGTGALSPDLSLSGLLLPAIGAIGSLMGIPGATVVSKFGQGIVNLFKGQR